MKNSNLFAFILSLLFAISCSSKKDDKKVADIPTSRFQTDSINLVAFLEKAIVEPKQADSLVMEAQAILNKNELHKDAYHYNLAEYYAAIGNYVSTKIEIQKGIENLGADTIYSKKIAKYYNLLGVIHTSQNEFEVATNYYTKALNIFTKQNAPMQAAVVYTNLANLFNSRSEFETALKYSLISDSLLTSINDTLYQGPSKSLLAVTYLYNKQVDSAFKYGFEAIAINQKHKKHEGIITAHVAVGEIHTYIDQFDSALYYFNTSKKLCETYSNKQALLIVENNLMYLNSKMGNYNDVILHGKTALALAQEFEEKNAEYDLFIALAQSYEHIGQVHEAYKYLKLAEAAYRDLSNKQNGETIQALLINFEDEKKNTKILIQDQSLQKLTYGTFILILFILTLLLTFFLYRRKNKHKETIYKQEMTQKILMAVTEGEEIERERIAMELHNGIASNLVGVRMMLEGMENKNTTLSKLEFVIGKTYDEVRLIAHNLMPVNFEAIDLTEAIMQFVEEMNSHEERVFFDTNVARISMPKEVAHILYRTTQEFVQNALKYAKATQILVTITRNEKTITLSIQDDGIGIEEEKLQHSNSITKTKKMLSELGITMQVDTKPMEYTIITIQLELTETV